MTIRRSKRLSWKSKSHKRRSRRRGAKSERDLRIESLEDRRLLAIGPQLAGIQLDGGELLEHGQVRNVAPLDLTFRFSDSIDVATVSGIRVTRSGLDGQFEHAKAATDFNTNGAVVMEFTAVDPGASGDGITIEVIRNALGPGVGQTSVGK